MAHRSRTTRLPLLILLAASAAGCQQLSGSRNDVAVAATLVEMSDALNQARQESADLQEQIDSLRTVVAKQDTVVRSLAAAAGIPFPP